MPSQMIPTPIVEAITDKVTGRLVALTKFEEFDLFMRRMEPLYALTSNYCTTIGADTRQRAFILLNAISDQSRKRSEAIMRLSEKGFPPPMFEVTPEGLKVVEEKGSRFEHIHAVERIMCQIENGQKELALQSCLSLRSRLSYQ